MSKIKLKETVKDIKVFDRAADVSTHMKNAFVKSKDTAEQTQEPGHNSPSKYATDNISNNAKSTAENAVRNLKNTHKKAAENLDKAKQHLENAKRQLPKQRKQAAEQAKKTAEKAKQTADTLKSKAEQAQKTVQKTKKAVTDAKRTLQQTRQAGRQTIRTAKHSIKSVKPAEKTIKTSAKTIKTAGKSSVKAAKNSVKTAERTAKATVKTAQQTTKAARKTAQASAKAAKAAAQASKAAAKAAVQTAKAATRVVIATVKAIIAATKALISAIIAGGWIAVAVILIICMIGLLVGSVFGIFFSGEDSGAGRSMPSVVSELTTEFYNKAEDIKNQHTHDVADIDAMSINWPEVLAVYAVKVSTDPDNAMEVATLDDGKVEKLRGVLNDMASLAYSLKTETQERTVTATDADGSQTETTESVTITTLIITLNQKSASDMASQYGFSQTRKDQMRELLSPDYADLWAHLLGGYAAGSGEILIPDGSHVPKDIFSWPIGEGHAITSGFGYRKDPFTGATKYHGGVDIAAPESTPILAAADGTVVIANSTDAWGGGWGFYVKIRHNTEYATLYAHCSRIAVRNGQEVKKGQVIAYVGTTGNSTGNHLHWEIYQNETRVNPLGFFE